MEGIAENNIANSDKSQIDSENPANPTQQIPTRQDVLLRLWKRADWIAQKVDCRNTKLTPELFQRVKLIKAECDIYHEILFGMKEVELVQLEQDITELKNTLATRNSETPKQEPIH
jgi:hypothetical protein